MREYLDIFIRFVKGMFIGTGFILPGVSGGALAAVFGIYERMITFVANPIRNFKRDFFFFVPVGFGGLFGLFLLSFALGFFLDNYEMQLLWFFIGCIVGTLPTLWKQAGKEGRNIVHMVVAAIVAVAGYFAFTSLGVVDGGQSAQTITHWTWPLVGGLIGLGAVIPGLSPSNFLILLGLLAPMTEAVRNLDLWVITQIGLGGLACILLLSKLMKALFDRAYPVMYHFIFGLVLATTAMIVPAGSFDRVIVISWLPLLAAGLLLGLGMGKMEEKYKTD